MVPETEVVMGFSAWVMLVLGVVVIYGGLGLFLWVALRKRGTSPGGKASPSAH